MTLERGVSLSETTLMSYFRTWFTIKNYLGEVVDNKLDTRLHHTWTKPKCDTVNSKLKLAKKTL
jgi:hypothetical protein